LPVLPPFCSDVNLNKNEKVANCCNAIVRESKIVVYNTTVGPVPDECSLSKCGRVCNRYFSQRRPESNTTEEPGCECQKKQTTKKPKHSCQSEPEASTKPPRNPYQSGPEPSTQQPGGQVASHKPPSGPAAPSSRPPRNRYPTEPETKPPRNPYQSGPEPSTQQPGGQVASHKPPSGPAAPSSRPPRNLYPSGPEEQPGATTESEIVRL